MDWTLIVLVVLCAFILVYNFYLPLREWVRSYTGSTRLFEAISTGIIFGLGEFAKWFGAAVEGLQEAQQNGYIPDDWVKYVPYILMSWIILKHVQRIRDDKKLKAK